MALRTLRDSLRKGLERRQGNPELVAQGLDEQGMGSDNALIGGPGAGRLEGVEARCDDVRRADVVVAEEGCPRGAPGELGGFEGWPAAQAVTEKGGSCVLAPWEDLREIVLQGAREAGGDPDCVVDDTAAVFDELSARAHGGALWLERLACIAMGAEQCALEGGVRGIVCGPARGADFAIPRQWPRIEGTEDPQVILAQGRD
jgi:hypothetical protein